MADHVVAAGRQLGPYRMEGRIGAGGMGEIYRARDTRLNRDVAIKILPPDVTTDLTRRERFDREARSIAALNHPHVCTVHDVGSADGIDYLVLELIDGQSLAERVARGPLPVAEGLARMIEVAEALSEAHRLGIIHRDLKPANIMLTRAGAKVLDFGLARIIKGATDLHAPPASTTAAALTADGAVFGTLQYMAPEQLEGRPADARTDVFAFGSVLYETLTARRPFEGATTPALISSILRDDPPVLTILRPGLPAAIERLVRACMAKNPDDRIATMHDVALALRWIASDLEKDQDAPRVVTGSPWHRRVLPGAIALAIGGALVSLVLGAIVWRSPRTVVQPAPEARLTMMLPASAPLSGGLAVSPDGTRLVYVSVNDRDRTSRLYLRQLDAFEPQPIAGTEGALAPFFSPDGQSIGFFAGGELRRMPLRGGEVVRICAAQADTATGGTWGVDDTIVFASPATARTGLLRVPAGGGVAQLLTTPDSREGGGHGDPHFIPGTRVVLYTTKNTRAGVATSIKAVSLDTAETRTILNDAGDQPNFSQPGQLLYLKGGALLTVPFSVKLLEVTGAPVTIADGVRQFASASSGRLVYRPATTAGGVPVWVGVGSGTSTTAILDGGASTYRRPRLSPDGTRLALEIIRGSRTDIGVYRFDTRSMTNLTDDGVSNSPVWTPDGRRILFRGPEALFWQAVDSTTPRETFLKSTDQALKDTSGLAPGVFSPNGSVFTFVVHGTTGTGADIWTMHVPERRLASLVQRPGDQWGVRISPDGSWISYASNESGRFEIYVEPLSGGGNKYLVSSNGGREGVWSPSGGELFYRSEDRMMAVPIRRTSAFPAGVPSVLFTGVFATTDLPNYDVARDGRFVMVQPVRDGTEMRTIRVIENWARVERAKD